jgi:predicted TIM-barrel fold metal-dependent hydrolase
MKKRLDGRSETILEPELPIIDAHHHLFDKPGLRYMVEEYLEDAQAGHRIVATVYVEGGTCFRQSGPEVLRPLGEVEFANGVGAIAESGKFGGLRLCAAIVGYADLRQGDSVGWLLDRAMAAAPDRFRGIRQITMDYPSDAPFRFFFSGRPPSGVLEHPKFRAGLAQLAQRGLVFDAAGFHIQLPELSRLADDFPHTDFVLNNLGIAMALDMNPSERSAVFKEWKANLAAAAQRANIYCKVSGLGMPFWGFDLHDRDDVIGSDRLAVLWRPYVETALELFGADRCLAGSNYPPDSRSCGFVPAWNALKAIAADCSVGEKTALFSGTAARVYRIAP